MSAKRKDNKGRKLRNGETQQPDGRYQYRYIDENGERKQDAIKELNGKFKIS